MFYEKKFIKRVNNYIKADDRYYEKSRNLFVIEGITGVGQYTLTARAFLAGFASFLGASDQFNGMIAVIPVATGVVQILSSLLFERVEKRKKLIIFLDAIFRLLLSIVFFIPFLFKNKSSALVILVIIYSTAYIIASFIGPALSNWIVDLTPTNIRGKYFAHKDKISLVFIAAITLILGRLLDQAKIAGMEYEGFAVIGIIVFVLGIINIIALINIKEPEGKNKKNKFRIKDVITIPLKNVGFRKIILLFILWNVALQIGGPFITVYMVTNLKLDYTYIMTLAVGTTVVRVIFANYWGKIADKKSWFVTTKRSIFALAVTHTLWGFVNLNSTMFLIPILHIISGFAWAGINISLFNIQFLFAKREGRTMYLGLNAAIGGISGLVSASIGAKIVEVLKGVNFTLLNINIGNMQLVFLISGLLLAFCSFFVHNYIEKADDEIEPE